GDFIIIGPFGLEKLRHHQNIQRIFRNTLNTTNNQLLSERNLLHP
ncbi:37408_t:CDS:1, partial [Gigaspora margarita]